MLCATSKDSDQPGHPHSLTTVTGLLGSKEFNYVGNKG